MELVKCSATLYLKETAGTRPLDVSTLEDEVTWMSRNVGHQSPIDAAQHARRMWTSTALPLVNVCCCISILWDKTDW